MRAIEGALLAFVLVGTGCRSAPAPRAETSPAPSLDRHAAEEDVVQIHQRGCDAGNAVACNDLGVDYLDGRADGTPNPTRAAPLLRRACDLKSAAGCGNLGWLYLQDTGIGRDPIRAAGLLTEACDGAFWFACAILADLRMEEGPILDVPVAMALYERACVKGRHQPSCGKLGTLYQAGVGVEKDEERARPLLEGSCDAGFALGCTGVGTLRVDRDPAGAISAYERGCTDANPTGCYIFGLMCTRKLAARCADRSEQLLRRACELQYPKACALLQSRTH